MSGPARIRAFGHAADQGLIGPLAQLHAQSFSDSWDAAALKSLIQSPGVFGLAAETSSGVAGFLLGRVAADEAEILTVCVAPHSRQRGIAAMLLEKAIATAIAAGARRLFLEVAASNTAAFALYRRAGFQSAGLRRGYYARPDGAEDAYILALKIS